MRALGLTGLIGLWLVCGSARLGAQQYETLPVAPLVELLTPEEEPETGPFHQTAFNPQLSTELPVDLDAGHSPAVEPLVIPEPNSDEPELLTDEPKLPSVVKPRLIRDNGASVTWIAPAGGFGITDVEARSAVVIPLFLGGLPPMIVGSFTTHLLDGPETLDLPARLYSGQIELRWYRQVRPWFGFEAAAGPNWFSDFEGGSNGMRVTGRAVTVFTPSKSWTAVVGVSYLGRQDLLLSPVGGIIWSPQPDCKVELMIPRPRMMRRVFEREGRAGWAYVGMELYGGNSWAVTLADRTSDMFTYRDFRTLVGFETQGTDLVNGRFEVGYVFARMLQFAHQPGAYNPDGTLMVRAGLVY